MKPIRSFFTVLAMLLSFAMLPGCSKSEGAHITYVLNECLKVSHDAGSYSDPGSQANFIAVSFQRIDVTDCPSDFRMAFQAHINAWQQASGAFTNNTGGTAFAEGFVTGVTGGTGYLGQASQQVAYATQQVNNTYQTLTMIAAKYGAKIPRSVAGE